jgi:dienelactone hydrolase
MRRCCLLIAPVLVACGGSDPEPEPDLSVETAGVHAVGTTRFDVTDDARGRTLTVQAWYPTADAAADVPVATLEPEALRATLEGAYAGVPESCATRNAHVAVDGAAEAGPFPLVLFSHCHDCLRWSGMTIAERLASHGFVVVAADHTDNTIYDYLDDTDVPLSAGFLPVRAGDVQFVLDEVLASGTLPIDPERIGVFGHSFGSVTAGKVAVDDDRIDAAFGIAAPFENPLLAGVTITDLEVPIGFLVAREDNSITELGNDWIRDNFAEATAPVWKIEVNDAGHWSFSDLVGLEPFPAGCGAGVRQTDSTDFTYLDAATGRGIAAAYVTAFFRAHLADDAGARAYLTSARPAGTVEAEAR